MNHSGIVDYEEVERVLKQREGLFKNWRPVGVLDVCDGVAKDCIFLNAEDLDKFLTNEISPKRKDTRPSFRIFLLESHGSDVTANGNPASEVEAAAVNPVALKLLRERAGLSNLLIAATCGVGHWYSVKQACFECQGDQEQLKFYEVYYEYVLGLSACTQFITNFESTTYFCLNLPKSVIRRFTDDIKRDPRLASYPFYLEILTSDEVLKLWQRDMKEQRSMLKKLEEAVKFPDIDSTTRELHKLSRHWFIHSRHLSDYETQLKFFQAASLRQSEIIASQSKNKQQLNEAREKTRINLLFHLANQAESRANIQIATQNNEVAELTAELAKRTQRDGAAMITIAAVTMFFLPGTFVAV
ncbi:hypothetical protein FQN54_006177 [Arachnomyces sp. PD_36]|nr:hypothetical protein FQN54_006177 [Arachnomyces sp. PD_36]